MIRLCFCVVISAIVAAMQVRAGVPADGLLVHLDAANKSSLRLDAAGCATQWKSVVPGAACVFTATGEKTAPKYVRGTASKRAGVRFDGNDDELAAPFELKLDVWTAVLVVSPRSNRMDAGGLFTGSPKRGHDYDPGFTIDMFNSKERFSSLSVEGAGRIGGAIDQMRADYTYGGMHLIVVERGTERIRMWIDGDEQEPRPVSRATTQIEVLRVGSRFYGGTTRNWFDGDIAQVLLYDRILKPGEHAAITQCLGIHPRERAQELSGSLNKQGERMVAPEVTKRWATTSGFSRYVKRHPEHFPFADLTRLPIESDLKESISLGMLSMNSMFDADKDQEPYFYSNRQADGTGALYHSVNIGIPHVVGRALWATMIGELATGIPFPEEGLGIYARYCRSSFDNPDHLNSYIDPARDNKRFIEFHNMR
ncbi:MAG: hypothetical protein K1Y02_23925, partial [Candidatus Hydrogenedentes bacterium]|nr:hypothetical protein [Candidatus Hydrogenedentota bacterium]